MKRLRLNPFRFGPMEHAEREAPCKFDTENGPAEPHPLDLHLSLSTDSKTPKKGSPNFLTFSRSF